MLKKIYDEYRKCCDWEYEPKWQEPMEWVSVGILIGTILMAALIG